MGNLVGIDLGTTFSAISRLDESGRPSIIHNVEGANITPSIVNFVDKNEADVGSSAVVNYGIDPNTFGRFKREMGTEKTFDVFGTIQTPATLSSFVLKKLKEDAETQIGAIDEAVVTIPANFANEAREATLDAAKLAGLNVKHIINEPTAAALYFAFTSGEELRGNYAIYDLGGGTFDISIIRVDGQSIEVVNSDGISKLGGDDFDNCVVDLVRKKFKEQTGGDLDPEDFTKYNAEEHKKILSSKESTKIRVASSKGREILELTRSEFEEAITNLVAQTEMSCEIVIDESNLSKEDIRDVILVGGSTRIPCIISSVQKVFQKEPRFFRNPDEAVTLGASLYVAYKADPSNLSPLQKQAVAMVKITDISTKCFGTIAARMTHESSEFEQYNDVLIAKGEKLPVSVTEIYETFKDGQVKVRCTVTESNHVESDPSFVKKIWEGFLELPEGRASGQRLEVTFSYDENQTMHCSFLDVQSGVRKNIDLRINAGQEEENAVASFSIN